MLTGILILSIVLLLAVLSHRRSRLEHRIYKNVPLDEWLNIIVFPTAFYIGWFIVMRSVISRPVVEIFPFDDFDILALTILFLAYGFVGASLHFTGKILWKFLSTNHHSMAYKVNEMFHGKLSHYLVFLCCSFIVFLLGILEINHPVDLEIASYYLKLIIIIGIVSGFLASKAVFYTNEWYGGYNKPLSVISIILFLALVTIANLLHMQYSSYPLYLFVASLFFGFIFSFILRQFFIFIRLAHRHRLRFLAKMFSIS